MKGWPVQLIGALLILASVVDLFLTVLYARSDIGLISPWLVDWVWRAFRFVGDRLPRGRDFFLSLNGPFILVILAVVWFGLLILGFACLYYPMLGQQVRDPQGAASVTFGTAIYFSATTMTTVGSGSSIIQAGAPQQLVAFESLLGISTLTLTLTYFVQIYNALLSRNALALKLHHASAATGDAAHLLAGFGAAGEFAGTRGALMEIVGELMHLYESHHFYSVLHVFRFPEPYYAPSRVTVLIMEMVTLIRSALDEEEYAGLRASASVNALWSGSLMTLRELSGLYLPGGEPDAGNDTDPQTLARWRRRYLEATAFLREAGLRINPDEDAGIAAYIEQRKLWEPYVDAFAQYMGHSLEVVDPEGVAA